MKLYILYFRMKFFTKGAIVPSPWAAPETRRATHLYKKSK